MYDKFTLVSLPWHALQSRLANAIGADHNVLAGMLGVAATVPASTSADFLRQSWLVRALLNARPGR